MKIPPDREADILAKAGEGWSHQRITDWLAQEHGVRVSRVAVTKLLGRLQSERADTAKAVVREKLAAQLGPGLDVLAAQTEKVRRLANRLYARAKTNQKAVSPFLKAVEQLRKNVDTQLHYSGADTPDDSLSALADAERRFLDKLARAAGQAERGAEGEAGAEPGGDPTGEGSG